MCEPQAESNAKPAAGAGAADVSPLRQQCDADLEDLQEAKALQFILREKQKHKASEAGADSAAAAVGNVAPDNEDERMKLQRAKFEAESRRIQQERKRGAGYVFTQL